MPTSETNTEAAEIATENVTPAVPAPEATEAAPAGLFTAEDISKARAQEKSKLYSSMEKMQEELSQLRAEREAQAAADAERKAKRAEREAEAAKKKQEEAEKEMSFKELLAKKESELQAQLEAERAEREKAFALLEREREFQELSAYRQQRLEQERSNIIPELIDLIKGDSKDEIEQSISELTAKSAAIFESVAQASQQTRKDMVGARVTAPASGPLDNNSDSASYSPDSIRDMSLSDYAKNRAKLLGTASNNRGQGLFG